jgi:very-short-patch-repair endonuclease
MKGQTNSRIRQSKLQRLLRRNMTDAEQQLWTCLRGGQLAGHKFRRQHPYRDCILDFVSLDARLVIEVEGSRHAGRSDQDAIRDQFLMSAGFRVLRFWNTDVLNNLDAVREVIWSALQPHPHPNLPPEGEGVKAGSTLLSFKGSEKPKTLPFKGRAGGGGGKTLRGLVAENDAES